METRAMEAAKLLEFLPIETEARTLLALAYPDMGIQRIPNAGPVYQSSSNRTGSR